MKILDIIIFLISLLQVYYFYEKLPHEMTSKYGKIIKNKIRFLWNTNITNG
jgi:hypothetical protein